MIGAFLPGVSPAGLGQYTLHAVVDGVEGFALEPDLLVLDLTAGQTAKSALIIKLHNLLFIKPQNDMEVDGSHFFALTQRRICDQFLIDNNINLQKAEDLVKYLDHIVLISAKLAEEQLQQLPRFSGSGYRLQQLNIIEIINYRYYFVADFLVEDFGSGDLTECFVYSAFNPEKAGYFIELLYFVRGFICSFLFDLGYNTPAQILLAQLHPKSFFGCDLFKELYSSLARRTGLEVGIAGVNIKHWFDFVAIHKIQRTLEGEHLFRLPGSKNRRPFFSPLVSYTKCIGRFHKFVVSGTGINFQYLTELLLSGTMKANQATAYDVISDLKPLDKGQAELYIRQMLSDHKIHDDQILEVVDLVCPNPLFLGRGRFVTFMLDSVLKGETVHLAISKFVGRLSQPEKSLFPLKFYVNDIQYGKNSFDKVMLWSLDWI
ncbi:hypothetical protein HDU83_006628 [Entophlyctis luteolus]|nr:hypothetical protein HDU83_006628 [Entophlyctis luteolus]